MIISNANKKPLFAQPSTLPNMGSTILDWFVPMVFVRVTKQIINFQVVESAININFLGVWQPLDARELIIEAQGQRRWKFFQVHSTPDLQLVPDEVILYLGTQYRVRAVLNYQEYGYMHYHLEQDYTGAGP